LGNALLLVNSTVAANRGTALTWQDAGVRSEVRFKNSIISGNRSGNCAAAPANVQVLDGGNNLQTQDTSCGTTIPVDDPKLEAIYFTPHPLSPARRAGDNAVCLAAPVSARDVYGERRPQADACTIGAVEGTVNRYAVKRLLDTPDERLERELLTLKRMLAARRSRER
jgi:hypothetical protein